LASSPAHSSPGLQEALTAAVGADGGDILARKTKVVSARQAFEQGHLSVAEELQQFRRELQAVRVQLDATQEQANSAAQQSRSQITELAQLCRGAKKIAATAEKQASAVQEELLAMSQGLGAKIQAQVAASVPAAVDQQISMTLETTRRTILVEVVAAALEEVRGAMAQQCRDVRTLIDEAVAGAVAAAHAPDGVGTAAARTLVQEAVGKAVTEVCGSWDAAARMSESEVGKMEQRAAAAEMKLRAVKAELEMKAVQPEMELRIFKAEQALKEARRRRSGRSDDDSDDSEDSDTESTTVRADDAEKAQATEPELVLGRYEVWHENIIGQGGFSVVRQGLDKQTGEVVAVKSYWDMEEPGDEADTSWLVSKCSHEVDVFKRLHAAQDVKSNIAKSQVAKRGSWYVPDGIARDDSSLMEAFAKMPGPSDLFVRMLDYSEIAGPNGVCYIVLELAEYTLHEYLDMRQRAGLHLMAEEVHDIALQLAQMLCGLHARSFVHADLKPLNVMHFSSGRWKLIDMDGMVSPGLATACDVCYTPYYCAPEIAIQFAERREQVHTSRLLDVWSLGMCFCELVTMSPVLEAMYNQLWELYNDSKTFLFWLSDPKVSIDVPRRVYDLDPVLADLVSRMLQKNPETRASMIEVMVHPYFTGDSGDGAKAVAEKSFNHVRASAGHYVRSLTLGVAARLGLLNPFAGAGGEADRTLFRRVSGMHDKRNVGELQQTHRRRVSALTFDGDDEALRVATLAAITAAVQLLPISDRSSSLPS